MMPTNNPFLQLKAKHVSQLEVSAQFGAAAHLWRQEEVDALILACAARRPLLVRGEAGSGKSQLARAAAMELTRQTPGACKVALYAETIHARFEAMDLLYRFDAVARLADAELKMLDPTNNAYLQKGTLWQAMQASQEGKPAVLLIDEIDKADADVPNALLGVLGNRSFSVPVTKPPQTVHCEHMPLVIITTNEERELPAAFVRRCIVLNQNPPASTDHTAFLQWLTERGAAHSHLHVDAKASLLAARQVLKDRTDAIRHGYPKVGLAEYIDLLTALHELSASVPDAKRSAEQAKWLRRLSAYALVKGADQDQARASLVADGAEFAAS